MNRRTFLRTAGAVIAALAMPVKWLVDRPVSTIRIAAYNAPPSAKAAADFVATGHDDDLILRRAAALMPAGGIVFLSEGDYYLSSGGQIGGWNSAPLGIVGPNRGAGAVWHLLDDGLVEIGAVWHWTP